MKNFSFFENCQYLEVKFSICLNRHVFIMSLLTKLQAEW